MPQDSRFREFLIQPVTGLLDTRSNPDELQENGYRWVDSFRVTQKNKLCRSTGWRRFLSKDVYNNADLHDQLSGYDRQHFTFAFRAKTLAGFSKLYLGTQNRIYAFNNATENWKVIADQMGGPAESGCPERRFSGADLNNIAVFTNNFDPCVYHSVDQPSIEDGEQAVSPIPDMDRLKISKVAIVYQWNNLMFYANVVMDGQRLTNRVLWSDYKRPLSLVPGSSSLAGRFDFDSGDDILGVLELGDSLFFYTSNGTWEARITGTTQVLTFNKRFRPSKYTGDRCLAFPNTLVSNGDSHFYWGRDGVYKYDFFEQVPQRVEWIHKASSIIFDDLSSRCKVHVGGFNSSHKEIWWSWARQGDDCPSMTFVINTEYPFSYFIPKGFSVFVNHTPFPVKSLRTWILENCICTLGELDIYGGGFVKEGGFCIAETDIVCATRPANFISGIAYTDPIDAEIVSESYLNPPDSDALHALLGETTEEDLCGDEYTAGECNASNSFLMVLVDDQCLKEEADVYYRELCVGFTGCGAYTKLGYRSILRSGPVALKHPSDDKVVNRFAIEHHPTPASVPSKILLRIGVASQAVDPNSASGRCVIQWEDQDGKEIQCLSDVDAARHAQDNTRPNDEMEWPLYQTGRYFYYELTIVNEDVDPQDTGGAVCFSRYSFNAALASRPVQ